MKQKEYDELRKRMIEISLRVPRGAHNRVAKAVGKSIQWSIQLRNNFEKNEKATDHNVELMLKFHNCYLEELKKHREHINNLNVEL